MTSPTPSAQPQTWSDMFKRIQWRAVFKALWQALVMAAKWALVALVGLVLARLAIRFAKSRQA